MLYVHTHKHAHMGSWRISSSGSGEETSTYRKTTNVHHRRELCAKYRVRTFRDDNVCCYLRPYGNSVRQRMEPASLIRRAKSIHWIGVTLYLEINCNYRFWEQLCTAQAL